HAYDSAAPRRGDIVVFHPPQGAESATQKCGVPRSNDELCPIGTKAAAQVLFIKRVVAVPGDGLKVIDNQTYVNGRRQSEKFARLAPCTEVCNLPKEITIPSGQVFVMGDNRGESDDSRDWGPIRERWIIGRVRQ